MKEAEKGIAKNKTRRNNWFGNKQAIENDYRTNKIDKRKKYLSQNVAELQHKYGGDRLKGAANANVEVEQTIEAIF